MHIYDIVFNFYRRKIRFVIAISSDRTCYRYTVSLMSYSLFYDQILILLIFELQ